MSPQLQQRMDALNKGNTIRTRRKELKQRIALGECDARSLLLGEIPDYALTMKISKVLKAVPKVGEVKAQKIIQRTVRRDLPLARISPTTFQAIAEMLPRS